MRYVLLPLLILFTFSYAKICNQSSVTGYDNYLNEITSFTNKVTTDITIDKTNMLRLSLDSKHHANIGDKVKINVTIKNISKTTVCNIQFIPAKYDGLELINYKIKSNICLKPNEEYSYTFKVKQSKLKKKYILHGYAKGYVYDSISITSNTDNTWFKIKSDNIRQGIVGIVYLDKNNNCQYDVNIDKPLSDVKVMLNDGRYVYTDKKGRYLFTRYLQPKNYVVKTPNVENPSCYNAKVNVRYSQFVKHNIPVKYIDYKHIDNIKLTVSLQSFEYNVTSNRFYVKKQVIIETTKPDVKVKLPKMYVENLQCNKPVIKDNNMLIFPAKGKYTCSITNDAYCLPFKLQLDNVIIQDNVCMTHDVVKLEVHFDFGKYTLPKEREERLIKILNDIHYLTNGKKVVIFITGHTDLRPVKPNNKQYRDNLELSELRVMYIHSLIQKTLYDSNKIEIRRE